MGFMFMVVILVGLYAIVGHALARIGKHEDPTDDQ